MKLYQMEDNRKKKPIIIDTLEGAVEALCYIAPHNNEATLIKRFSRNGLLFMYSGTCAYPSPRQPFILPKTVNGLRKVICNLFEQYIAEDQDGWTPLVRVKQSAFQDNYTAECVFDIHLKLDLVAKDHGKGAERVLRKYSDSTRKIEGHYFCMD